VPLLPGEDVVVDIRLPRQHPALAERAEGGVQGPGVNRGRIDIGVRRRSSKVRRRRPTRTMILPLRSP
jgi:hypothetical protein